MFEHHSPARLGHEAADDWVLWGSVQERPQTFGRTVLPAATAQRREGCSSPQWDAVVVAASTIRTHIRVHHHTAARAAIAACRTHLNSAPARAVPADAALVARASEVLLVHESRYTIDRHGSRNTM